MYHTALIGPSPRISVDHCGDGELVICLHGIGGNKRNWHGNLEVFGTSFHAVAWDARGYGESEDYEGPLEFSSFAHDVARVLDYFEADMVHIVGLSMGGRIAGFFHRLYPKRVKSLVLCDTHLGFEAFTPQERQEFVRLRKEPLLNGKEPKDIAPVVAATLIGDPANTLAFERLVDSMSRLHKESYIKTIESSVNLDHADLFSGVDVPTLVMAGELDTLTTPVMAKRIADKIKNAELVTIPAAGHSVNIEQPEVFNQVVLDFLKRQATDR